MLRLTGFGVKSSRPSPQRCVAAFGLAFCVEEEQQPSYYHCPSYYGKITFTALARYFARELTPPLNRLDFCC